jgi:hypothetical protein
MRICCRSAPQPGGDRVNPRRSCNFCCSSHSDSDHRKVGRWAHQLDVRPGLRRPRRQSEGRHQRNVVGGLRIPRPSEQEAQGRADSACPAVQVLCFGEGHLFNWTPPSSDTRKIGRQNLNWHMAQCEGGGSPSRRLPSGSPDRRQGAVRPLGRVRPQESYTAWRLHLARIVSRI